MADLSTQTAALSQMWAGWFAHRGYASAAQKRAEELAKEGKKAPEIQAALNAEIESTLRQHHPDLWYGLDEFTLGVSVQQSSSTEVTITPTMSVKKKTV